MSPKLCKVVSYAKLSWRKYSNLYIDLGLPVRAVKASILPSPRTVYFTAQLVNKYTAEEAEAYCESPFCLLQEEVRTLQYFMFQAWSKKIHHRIHIGGPWVLEYTLGFPQFLEYLEEF